MQDSLVSGNATDGVAVVSSAGLGGAAINITTSQVSGNFNAGLSANGAAATGAGSATVRAGASMIVANAVGIAVTGQGQVRSHGNNQVVGNSTGETFSALDALK